jgi:hypothetical protein
MATAKELESNYLKFSDRRAARQASVVVKAGDLHRAVGG